MVVVVAKGLTCMCGFSFSTPHGEDEAVAIAQYHVSRVHKKEYPNGVSRAEALKMIKNV